MARQRRLDRMPEVKNMLNKLLLDGKYSEQAMAEFLDEYRANLGYDEPVTLRVVNNYAVDFKEMAKEAVETDRLAETMIKEMGISNQSNVSKASAEILRVLIFRFMPMLKGMMAGEEIALKDMKSLSEIIANMTNSHARMEKSASEREKLDREIEKRAAEKAAAALREAGVNEDTIKVVERVIVRKEVQSDG